jgi:hypothetical protein
MLDLPRDASFATDDQGRWRCAILPASWEAGEMYFRITHPRFLGSGPSYDRRLPIKDLRALSAVAVLETGYTLSGTVTDQHGRPIEGAAVVWHSLFEESGSLRVRSGADGRFQLGATRLTATLTSSQALEIRRESASPADRAGAPGGHYSRRGAER